MLLSLRAKIYALKCIFFSYIVKPVCNTYRNVDVKPKKRETNQSKEKENDQTEASQKTGLC